MEHVLGLLIGVGLSAACGFRVFIPLLGMNIAHLSGHLTLAPGFEWMGSWAALVAFGTATVIEIVGYFVPWLDNILDAAATPAAVIAATILTASQVGEMSPLMRWSLAAVAGGGVCATIQAGTVALRATSTGTTGGLGNFLVSTSELIAASFLNILAIVVPVLCFFLVAILGVWSVLLSIRWFASKKPQPVLVTAGDLQVAPPVRRKTV